MPSGHVDTTSDRSVASSHAISRRDLLKGGAAVAAAGLASPLLSSAGASAAVKQVAGRGYRKSVKKTKLRLMTWELYEPPEIGAWRKTVAEFTAANPSIEVVWSGWPFANYDQNVIAQAQAGSVDADVVMCPPELGSTLIQDYHLCEPLGFIASDLGLVPNEAHKQFEVNGKLYLLGILEVAFLLAYDRRMFERAGFSRPPATTEEWLAYTEKLTKPPQQYGNMIINTAAAAADNWNQMQNWPLGFGGTWAKGKSLTINSPENIRAMEYWVKLVKASGLAGTSEAAQDKLWYNDQIAMQFTVGFGSSALKQLAPKLYSNITSAPPPWPGRKAIARLHGNVVLKTSPSKEAAYELVRWMIEPKNLWNVYKANGYPLVPYSNFAKFIPEYPAFERSLPWQTGFQDTNYVGESTILGDYVFAYAQIGNIIATNMSKAVSGSSSVADALHAAQTIAQESLHLP